MDTNELLNMIQTFQNLSKEMNGSVDEELNQYVEELKKVYDINETEETETIGSSINKTTTKFINNSNNPDPKYAKEGDSGFDLRAFIDEPVTLKPLERKLIPTGLKFELSPNTELQVRPRSGMALKHGISVLNTPGTVDEGYRGDVGIIAVNLSNEDYTIEPGERIAQAVIMNVIGHRVSNLEKVETLTETERGDTGYGSSGKN
jgi:dUTP pyrophosphatase